MQRQFCLMGTVVLTLFLLLIGTASGQDACRWESNQNIALPASEPAMETGDKDTYTGTIRIYVTEKIGRYNDSDGIPWHNMFVSFALEEAISVSQGDSLMWSIQWDGHDYGFGDLAEDDIKVMAAVFNSSGYTGYSDPPSGAPFTVREIDACAGAMPGETGYNERNDDFTHSVFVEDGSTTW